MYTSAVQSLDDGLDSVLQLLDLVVEGTLGVPEDRRSDDVARNTTSATKVGLLGHVDIDDILRQKRDWVNK